MPERFRGGPGLPSVSISALAIACVSCPVVAAAAPGPAPTDLDRVVVAATRTGRAIEDVPATVDVIDRDGMDRLIVRDLRDLFRYEPGITVTSGFGRFGLGDIRIRGLGGNRVRIQTDGVAVPDAFAIGSFSNANRNFVDVDTLKRVEVVRGPASSLYGSDALGGVVAFVTRDPSDYLEDGKDAAFDFKLGYESDWDGVFGGATAAFGAARWSGLVAVGHRQGRETANQARRGGAGAARTLPNPQSRDGRSLLAKLVFAPDDTQRLRLTVEGNEDRTRTGVLTSLGFQPFTGATNTRVEGDDHQTRARVSLAHERDATQSAWADRLDWQIYRQDSETTQDTLEERTLPPPVLRDRRERTFNFDQRTWGVQANLHKTFDTGAVRHDLAYGLEFARTDTRQKRDGRRTFLTPGVVSPVVSPDVFPVRDFPISETTVAALYLQDEMQFADGALRVIPAVRIDSYRLEPRSDAIFAGDNPGVAIEGLDALSVSPKLGMVWHPDDDWSLFGGYTRGFRSPPYNDVNVGFTNLQFGYTAISNPALRAETSDGLEAGVRFVGDAAYAGLSVFYNRYDDFIESLRFVRFDPMLGTRGLSVFQSQNIAEATIRGAELKAGMDLGARWPGLAGWSLRGAAAWARGRDETRDVPLDSVDPLTGTLGLAFERGGWGAELAGRFVARKRESSDPALFRSPGYGVLDLFVHWAFAPGARLGMGVSNLADRRYYFAGDVPRLNAGSSTLERYTAPGRNVAVSLGVSW